MKNRKYLNDMNLCDMLMQMNSSIMSLRNGTCIMNAFMDEYDALDRCGDIFEAIRDSGNSLEKKCAKCIAEFLEEEKS